tara:strand:+ start:2225 stop:2497 length:273 start_codon:yes stop_codon:yes gene_type:complete
VTEYFEMRDALFAHVMKKAKWHCVPRGFSPFTRDVPSYTVVCTLDTPEGILVESRTVSATEFERAKDQRLFVALLVAKIGYFLKLSWHAS